MDKKTYGNLTIQAGFLTDHLFADTTGIDVQASVVAYAEALEDAISEEYPGATVEIEYQDGEGCLPGPLQTRVYVEDSDDEPADADLVTANVDEIKQRVWQDFDLWLVDED